MFSFSFFFLIYSVIPLSQFSLSCDSWRLGRFLFGYNVSVHVLLPSWDFFVLLKFFPHDDLRDRGRLGDFNCDTCNTKTPGSSACQLMLVMVSSVADIFERNNNHTHGYGQFFHSPVKNRYIC